MYGETPNHRWRTTKRHKTTTKRHKTTTKRQHLYKETQDDHKETQDHHKETTSLQRDTRPPQRDNISTKRHKMTTKRHNTTTKRHKTTTKRQNLYKKTQDHHKETQDHHKETQDNHKETQDHHKETQDNHKKTQDHQKETQDHHKKTQDNHKETQDHHKETTSLQRDTRWPQRDKISTKRHKTTTKRQNLYKKTHNHHKETTSLQRDNISPKRHKTTTKRQHLYKEITSLQRDNISPKRHKTTTKRQHLYKETTSLQRDTRQPQRDNISTKRHKTTTKRQHLNKETTSPQSGTDWPQIGRPGLLWWPFRSLCSWGHRLIIPKEEGQPSTRTSSSQGPLQSPPPYPQPDHQSKQPKPWGLKKRDGLSPGETEPGFGLFVLIGPIRSSESQKGLESMFRSDSAGKKRICHFSIISREEERDSGSGGARLPANGSQEHRWWLQEVSQIIRSKWDKNTNIIGSADPVHLSLWSSAALRPSWGSIDTATFMFPLSTTESVLREYSERWKTSEREGSGNVGTVGQRSAGTSFNQGVGGSIPARVDVSLSKTLSPEWLPVPRLQCMNVPWLSDAFGSLKEFSLDRFGWRHSNVTKLSLYVSDYLCLEV